MKAQADPSDSELLQSMLAAAHASGTVKVEVTIDEDGNVVAARVVSGHPLLQAAAVAAARQAKLRRGSRDSR